MTKLTSSAGADSNAREKVHELDSDIDITEEVSQQPLEKNFVKRFPALMTYVI